VRFIGVTSGRKRSLQDALTAAIRALYRLQA
jgi:hypothetical protein